MNVSPNGGGITKVNQSIISSFPVVPSYDRDTAVTLEALPNSGFKFINWSGDLNSNENPITIIIDCDKQVTANFNQVKSYSWLIGITIAGIVIVGAIILVVVKVQKS